MCVCIWLGHCARQQELTQHCESTIKKKRQKGKATLNIHRNSYKDNADFSAGTVQAIRECQGISKVVNGRDIETRLFYPARLLFWFGGEIKSFSDKLTWKRKSKPNTTLKIANHKRRKKKRKKKNKKIQNKMAISTYL